MRQYGEFMVLELLSGLNHVGKAEVGNPSLARKRGLGETQRTCEISCFRGRTDQQPALFLARGRSPSVTHHISRC